MRNQITYQWDVEEIDENGDIIEHWFADTLEELRGRDGELVLVRYEGNDIDGEIERFYAYAKDGKLPEMFADETGAPISIKVPKRFHNELAKYYSQQKPTQ